MKDVIETADAIHASANRLYWHSHDSVEELASRLGMSRHALYSSIRPLPAGVDCECGAQMVFANRTRRAAGHAHCQACGATETIPAERVMPVRDTPPPRPLAPRRALGQQSLGVRAFARRLAAVSRERFMMIGGAAALGVAAGLAAVNVVRGGHPPTWM